VFKFVKRWKLGLPLHVEYRTFPMLFYVPPLLPVMSKTSGSTVDTDAKSLFSDIEKARAPLAYLGRLFGAGNDGKVRYALRKQMAVRIWRRHLTVGDVTGEVALHALREADCTPEDANAIYELTALASMDERVVVPPMQREQAIEMLEDPHEHRQSAGFGFREFPMSV
jgi:nitrate reductase beta subunit